MRSWRLRQIPKNQIARTTRNAIATSSMGNHLMVSCIPIIRRGDRLRV
jgi:hypothetical protein